MNQELLAAIQQVENESGSMNNPKADLSNVHKIVKSMGLYGRVRKSINTIWFSKANNSFVTNNPKLVHVFRLLKQDLSYYNIIRIEHTNSNMIRKVKRVLKRGYHLSLATQNERFRAGMATV